MEQYKSATINVDTNGTEINPPFDIFSWSVYSRAGDFTVEVYTDSYGDAIQGFNGMSLSQVIGGQRIRIKSVTGTIAVTYIVQGK